jgi:uncharacterized membrane protein YccC
MLYLWTGIGVALIVFPVAFAIGRYVGAARAGREQRALANLSRALDRILQKAFPRSGQQYSTIRREEAEELAELLAQCNRLAGSRPAGDTQEPKQDSRCDRP